MISDKKYIYRGMSGAKVLYVEELFEDEKCFRSWTRGRPSLVGDEQETYLMLAAAGVGSAILSYLAKLFCTIGSTSRERAQNCSEETYRN